MTSRSPSADDTALLIALIDRGQGSSISLSTTSLMAASSAVSPSAATASAYTILPPTAHPRSASSPPLTASPSSSILVAAPLPTLPTSLLVPPHPVDAPLLACTKLTFASRESTTRSAHVVSSAPPPAACPSTAATTGTGRDMRRLVRAVMRWSIREPSRGRSAWGAPPRLSPPPPPPPTS